MLDFAFICDMILNELNLTLQGKDKQIFDLVSSVTHFGRRLDTLSNQLTNNELTNLKRTKELYRNQHFEIIKELQKIVENLIENYKKRFIDFEQIKSIIDIFAMFVRLY